MRIGSYRIARLDGRLATGERFEVLDPEGGSHHVGSAWSCLAFALCSAGAEQVGR